MELNVNSKTDLRGRTYNSGQLQAIFSENLPYLVNPFKAYALIFNRLPSSILLEKMKVPEAMNWVKENFGDEIRADWQYRRMLKKNGLPEIDDNLVVLSEDMLLYFDTGWKVIRILYGEYSENQAFMLEEQLRNNFRQKEKVGETRLHLIQSEFDGLKTENFVLKSKPLNLEMNYNDDLYPVHQTILENIRNRETAGVILLYGKPGTGKTTYIRHLISQTRRSVIYLPADLASNLGNPVMMRIWKDLPNSICVIEDAELVLSDRGKNANSPVTSLLNLSDGFLAQCFHILFICTFNVPLSDIDPALTRKGRLLAGYEFKELERSKAQALSDHLGFETRIEKDMTLVEVFHQETENFHVNNNRIEIGFLPVKK
jgi:DNA replication protein DnaC